MTIDGPDAKAPSPAKIRSLLAQRELDLYQKTRPAMLAHAGDRQLTDLLTRARRYEQKFRDLFRDQTRSTRESIGIGRGSDGAANERTLEKQRIFGAVVASIEAEVATRQAVPDEAAPEKPASRPAKARSTTAEKPPTDPATRAAAKHDTTRTPRNIKISSHSRAQQRRNQAKRDGR